MKFRIVLAALAAVSPIASLYTPLHAAPGTLTVDVAKPGVRISPHLYGIFFEEINNAGDGGLYGELLRNRNFEESDQPDHWKLVLGGNAKGDIAIGERAESDATAFNRRHLTITHQTIEGPAGVDNRVAAACDGYWGISVAGGGDPGSLTMRWRSRDGGATPPIATLEGKGGGVWSSARVVGPVGEPDEQGWRLTKLQFHAPEPVGLGNGSTRLVLALDRPGSVEVDFISMMLPVPAFGKQHEADAVTYKPSPIRHDLAEKLVALQPAFFRFPGGCWVEGETMATAYRWKRTIGPLWDRWTQPNLWGYQSTNGLGYHEYLQLCENLGATAMFVANVGMSHKEVVPMDQMGPWVQDALDAIEYALGDATTTWGKRRAEAGHPAPFRLDYVEIGNENGGPAYDERYALFYDAIKAKYPQVKTIACEWNGRPKSRPIEILDEHYYRTPQWFFAKHNMYDAYPRDGYKVYVGEYAVTQGSGAGNLISALGEAAFMTGMERNSDVVVMSSYAPLFTNVDGKRWNPDLINFDNARSYGTPSYHVQQMFAAHRGDVVLPVTLSADVAVVTQDTKRSGQAGVGTWSTRAEYKDFEVVAPDGKTLYRADLNDAEGWTLDRAGNWDAAGGVLAQRGDAENVQASVGDAAWADYSVRVKARKTGGREGFLVVARRQGEGDHVWFNVGGWGNTAADIERSRDGGKESIGRRVDFTVEADRWYDLRLDVKGDVVEGYVDGKLVTAARDVYEPANLFAATASRDESSGDVIVKVVNGSDAPREMNVTFDGATSVGPRATAITMTGGPQDENTLDAPMNVAPETRDVAAKDGAVPITFPKHSVTVLRVPAK